MEPLPLPNLSELFQEPHPVITSFLEGLDSPYGYWYPVNEKGEVDESEAKQMFLGHQKRLGDDELTGAMPLMRYQPVRGVEDHMLLDAFDEERHALFDVKSEEEFRSKRRAMGPTHPALRTFGSSTIFGGLESKFDHMAVIKGPLFVGRGCKAYSMAKIIGPTLLGDQVTLNTSSAVTRSVVGSYSQVDRTEIKDAIIGRHVWIKSGVELCHRISLENDERIEVPDRRAGVIRVHQTGRVKMGCVIGDGCQIGAKSVIGPGSILMPGCRVKDGSLLSTGIYDQAAIDRYARPV